jgi:hypothetical protein
MASEANMSASSERLPDQPEYALNIMRENRIKAALARYLTAGYGTLHIDGLANNDTLQRIARNTTSTTLDNNSAEAIASNMQGIQLACILEPFRTTREQPLRLSMRHWLRLPTKTFMSWVLASFSQHTSDDPRILKDYDDWQHVASTGQENDNSLFIGYIVGVTLIREADRDSDEMELLEHERIITDFEFTALTAQLDTGRRQNDE